MKTYKDWNLDDQNEAKDFINTFGTLRGRALANRLGITGRHSERTAIALVDYAWNKLVAMDCRSRGDVRVALIYEGICDSIYKELPEDVRW